MNFRVLESKFVKFLTLILKRQVSASFFIVMTHNSSVSFKLMHFLLEIKGSHHSPNLETFESCSENLPNYCQFSFSNFASLFSFIKDNSSVLCSKGAKKWDFLRLLSAWIKIRQISRVNFEMTSQFLFNFFIILQYNDT